MKAVAIIPARGGSVRVPRKNIKPFKGKPMLRYPIEAARASNLFDQIIVSTDDTQIAAVAFEAGATVVPRPIDDGSTGTQEIAANVLDALDTRADLACVIYPCTPLLTVDHLTDGLHRLLMPDAKAFAYSVGPDGVDAGAYYWGWTLSFRHRIPLQGNSAQVTLPAECVCDINTPDDWDRAQELYEAHNAMLNQRGHF